jgi:hypothetical protein
MHMVVPTYASVLHITLRTFYLTTCRTVLLERRHYDQLANKYPSFLQLRGLFPCSQKPVARPCPEPDESSPYHPVVFS